MPFINRCSGGGGGNKIVLENYGTQTEIFSTSTISTDILPIGMSSASQYAGCNSDNSPQDRDIFYVTKNQTHYEVDVVSQTYKELATSNYVHRQSLCCNNTHVYTVNHGTAGSITTGSGSVNCAIVGVVQVDPITSTFVEMGTYTRTSKSSWVRTAITASDDKVYMYGDYTYGWLEELDVETKTYTNLIKSTSMDNYGSILYNDGLVYIATYPSLYTYNVDTKTYTTLLESGCNYGYKMAFNEYKTKLFWTSNSYMFIYNMLDNTIATRTIPTNGYYPPWCTYKKDMVVGMNNYGATNVGIIRRGIELGTKITLPTIFSDETIAIIPNDGYVFGITQEECAKCTYDGTRATVTPPTEFYCTNPNGFSGIIKSDNLLLKG